MGRRAPTFGSLFAGVGGFDKGLEAAGFTPRWQVELSAFRRAVLAKHWPDVPRRHDVRKAGRENLAPVDLICGGFPCQDISHARPKRVGLRGTSGNLWIEFARVIDEIHPALVLVENVGHAWATWVPRVRRDFQRLGYASLPLSLSAAEVGADHVRRRVFVLAHTDSERLRLFARRWRGPRRKVAPKPLDPRWGTSASRMARGDDGVPFGLERRRALGDVVVPQVVEVIGRVLMGVFFADAP